MTAMTKRHSFAIACLVSALMPACAGRAWADAAALRIVAPWLRVSPDGVGELFFAAANPGVGPRSILGAETAAGAPSKPGAAIVVPPHETVFVESPATAIRLAAPQPPPAPGEIVPLTLMLDDGVRLEIEAIAAAPGDEIGPEIFAFEGKRIQLQALDCDQLREVSADVQAAIGAWILAYLHEPIDDRAVRSVLGDLGPGCEDHPDAVLLDIVDMLGGEGD
jgi:copper(I)-binding protein